MMGFAREVGYGEILGGEAASLREAPLPPDPSLPKSGWRLSWVLLRRWFRLSVGRSPIGLVVVTAADRAAVTCLGEKRQKRLQRLDCRWSLFV